MRPILPVLAVLVLALTGCDDQQQDGADDAPPSPSAGTSSPSTSPTPAEEPTGLETGSEAPAPDVPGPERSLSS